LPCVSVRVYKTAAEYGEAQIELQRKEWGTLRATWNFTVQQGKIKLKIIYNCERGWT
jgi:hypothetical protein